MGIITSRENENYKYIFFLNRFFFLLQSMLFVSLQCFMLDRQWLLVALEHQAQHTLMCTFGSHQSIVTCAA